MDLNLNLQYNSADEGLSDKNRTLLRERMHCFFAPGWKLSKSYIDYVYAGLYSELRTDLYI